MNYDLVDIFKKHFDIKIARTNADLEKIFKLRYDVFCAEFHFEDEANCPNQLETDNFDNQSVEAFLVHAVDESITGCVRLILPSKQLEKLPFEHFTEQDFLPTSTTKFAEVSRLTVAKDFRRRKWDGQIPSGVSSDISQLGEIGRNFPLPALSMIFCGAALSRIHLLDYTYAMMEPRLAFAMYQYGIHFDQVGKLVSYHGERASYRVDPIKLWQTIDPNLKPLLNFIYFKVSQAMYKPLSKQRKKIG